jgi:hypothetical protein
MRATHILRRVRLRDTLQNLPRARLVRRKTQFTSCSPRAQEGTRAMDGTGMLRQDT